tara:strand:- start:20278 stop:20481 length:204 start_codon:yes stop_codon:yes gene_type:complete
MTEFNFPEGTKREDAVNELIDDEQFKEMVLKQFNYMRIKKINLVQDADDMVNLYLKICKAFEEGSED